MVESTNRRMFLAATGIGIAGAALAGSQSSAEAQDKISFTDIGQFEFKKVDGFDVDQLDALSEQGWEIKAVLPAEIKGHPDLMAGGGSGSLTNDYWILLQRRKPPKTESKLVEYHGPRDINPLLAEGWQVAGFTAAGGGPTTLFVLLVRPLVG